MSMETNGQRDVACFMCRNAISRPDIYVERSGGGFHHQFSCKVALPMPNCDVDRPDEEIVASCSGGKPCLGFQIGGYYSHMWFEADGACLAWSICSDGDFPTDKPEFVFHICDFKQIERFVDFWGKELRRRGLVPEVAR